jgi:hypothetical protein
MRGLGRSHAFATGHNQRKMVKAIISRRSKIKIAKKNAKRKNLKKGLTCAITLAASGAVAHTVTCN